MTKITFTKRGLLRTSLLLVTGCALIACNTASTPSTETAAKTAVAQATAAPVPEMPVNNAEDALKKLIAGNQRFVTDKPGHPHQSAARRTETAAGQKPFAIVLGCADSRVAPEQVFDQGIGDLFVVRVAGNVLDNTTLGSLEFAVAEFGAPLIVVLGHEKCGAVKATIEALEHKGEKAPGEIPSLVSAIQPAVEHVKGKPGDLLDNGVRENIARVVDHLKKANPVLTKALKDGKLKIVGARYDLDTGAVEVTVP